MIYQYQITLGSLDVLSAGQVDLYKHIDAQTMSAEEIQHKFRLIDETYERTESENPAADPVDEDECRVDTPDAYIDIPRTLVDFFVEHAHVGLPYEQVRWVLDGNTAYYFLAYLQEEDDKAPTPRL